MSALAYDTHRAVKSLVAAGFDPTRAEAVVATVGDAMTGTVADIAGPQVGMSRMKAELYRLVLVSSMAVVGPAAAPIRLIPQVRDL